MKCDQQFNIFRAFFCRNSNFILQKSELKCVSAPFTAHSEWLVWRKRSVSCLQEIAVGYT